MAKIQLPGQSASTDIEKWPSYRVFTRDSLREGPWTPNDRLQVLRINETASPVVPTAFFRFVAGQMLYADGEAFEEVDPLSLIDQFVRVDLLPDAAPAPDKAGNTKPPKALKTWIFRIGTDDRDQGVDAETRPAPVFQQLVGMGLEDLLDQITVFGGYGYDDSDGNTEQAVGQVLHSPMVFNEQGRIGLTKRGNRSKEMVEVPDTDPVREAYAFDLRPRDDGTPADLWSVADIIDYLIRFWVLDWELGVPREYGETERGIYDALTKIKPMKFSAEGLSVKAAIDRLVRPERGLGWCFRYAPLEADDESATKPELHIFPINDTELKLDEAKIPANEERVSLNLSRDTRLQEARIGDSAAEQFDDVVVLGARVLSCFTVAYHDNTLDQDWTAQEESQYREYAEVAEGSEDTPKFFASDIDRYKHVFCRYRLPSKWNGFAANGDGGAASLVVPRVNSDAQLVEQPASLNRLHQGFEQQLPIEDKVQPTESGGIAKEKRYRLPFVLARYAETIQVPADHDSNPLTPDVPTDTTVWRYGYVDQMPASLQGSLRVSFPADRHVVELEAEWPHVLANPINTPEPTKVIESHYTEAQYSWQELIATVALRLDQRLYVQRQLRAGVHRRRLIIEVPDAELWLIAPGTVTEIVGGQLEHYSGDRIVRNDVGKLKDIAEAAKVWYGKARGNLSVTWRGIKLGAPIGSYVAAVAKDGEQAVNLCVTSIVWDFEQATTTVAANYRDLDFSEV